MSPAAPSIQLNLDALPRFPDTGLRLIRALNDPETSFRQLTEIVRHDVAVTAGILRLCNSVYLGLREKIGSIDHAARFLGTSRLLQVTLAVHVQSLLAPQQRGYGLAPGELWAHALGVAIAAQKLAARTQSAAPDLAFTSGLLHDVGKLLLSEQVGERYAEIVTDVRQRRASFHEAERRVLGITHAEVGALATERWGLPESLVAAVRYHHEPESAGSHGALTDLVHLADVICVVIGIGGGDDGLMYDACAAALVRRGLSQGDLEPLAAEVILEVRALREAFAAR